LHLRWEDLDGFTRIKSAIPWEFRVDPKFEKAILRKNRARFVELQLARSGRFFVVHPPPPDRLRFPGLPDAARRLYARAYNGVFRIDTRGWRLPVMPVLFVIGLTACVAVRSARPAGVVSAAMLAYYAAIVALLTYQDGLFIRMRIAVEPELLFLAAAPLVLFLATIGRQGRGGGAGALAGAAPPGA
jgi:hypothetical protein